MAVRAALDKMIKPHLAMGLRIDFEEQENAYMVQGELRMEFPYEDEQEKEIMLADQKRFLKERAMM